MFETTTRIFYVFLISIKKIMKKSFKKVFSGLAGLLIVGVLFGVLIKVSAAFSSIHITAPSDAGLVLSGTTTITWTEVGNTGSGIDIHLSSDG